MKNIAAVVYSHSADALAQMAVESLKKTAQLKGQQIHVEYVGPDGVQNPLDATTLSAAQVVLLAADQPLDMQRFAGKPVLATPIGEVVRHTQQVIDSALALTAAGTAAASASTGTVTLSTAPASSKKLVGITSCPTGIAHTFMAAEALQKAATALGYEIKVETQGSIGSKNELTAEDIASAEAVVIAADNSVNTARFGGKRLYITGTNEALRNGRDVIKKALQQPVQGASADLAASTAALKAERSKNRTGVYKHLMTGVSYMLPLVVAGGLCIALAFAVGGIYAGKQHGTFAAALSSIGGVAFQLYVAIFSAFIAWSIADRPGITPGLVGGLLAQTLGAGFLGGIISGFAAGYLVKFLAAKIKLPDTLEGLKPVLILPLISTLIIGLLMIYVIAPPTAIILDFMTQWLKSLQGPNALLLGGLLGAMMAFDMGGPINKAAYTFSTGLLASQIYTPMAAVMAAGMTPPLGLALAAWLFKRHFDADERKAAWPALVLGLSFITEGAIPFAAKDPLRVIPSLMIGSAVAGAISMMSHVNLMVPHGGIFAVLIPHAVTHLLVYLLALAAGTVVTAGALYLLKKPVAQEA